jgi:hypothetical protein
MSWPKLRRVLPPLLLVLIAAVAAVILSTGGGTSLVTAVAGPGPSATAGPPPELPIALRRGMNELVTGDYGDVGVGWNSGNGLWGGHAPPNWWQSALALLTVVRYLDATHDPNPLYEHVLTRTYERNVYRPRSPAPRDFADKFMDDTAWWGLAWLEASHYELDVRHDAGEAAKFLAVAEYDANYVESQPRACGGIPWEKGYPPDTVTSAEFISLAAGLATYRGQPGLFHDAALSSQWLGDARQALDWLESVGLIKMKNGEVIDRLNARCDRYLGGPMTYTEGEVADALVALGNATHDRSYYAEASRFLRYPLWRHSGLLVHGVLQDHCEATRGNCQNLHDHWDFPSYKGVYVNAVADWSAATGSHFFDSLLRNQAVAVLRNATRIAPDMPNPCSSPSTCQFTLNWRVAVDTSADPPAPTVATQQSAMDALIAEFKQSQSRKASHRTRGGRARHAGKRG